MKVYTVDFNMEIWKVEADVVTIEYYSPEEQYQKLTDILGADGIDVLDYNDDIAILVDEIGFQKTNNPIYKLVVEEGYSYELAGKLLFVRNIYNEYSVDFGTITYEDIFHLRRLLDIQIIGAVR